jgi:hypothetical protein
MNAHPALSSNDQPQTYLIEFFECAEVEVTATAPVIPACQPLILPSLHLEGRAFNFAAEGGSDEYLSFSQTPSATTATASATNPIWYRGSAANPADTCGGREIDFDWTNIQELYFDYSNGPSANLGIGGAIVQFSVPAGIINFPGFASGSLLPGQSVITAIPGGGVARLRYIHGPTNANAPRGEGAFCGALGGSWVIGLHRANVTNTDQPQILEFEAFEDGCIEPIGGPNNSILAVNYFAFDDSLGNREGVGNFSVAPSFTGRAKETTTPGLYGASPQPTAANVNSATAGQVVFVWDGVPQTEMDYRDVPGAAGLAQESIFQVFYNGSAVSWPAFGELAVAASVVSLPAADGHTVRLTALTGNNGSRPRRDPTVTNIRIGAAGGTAVPVRYRLEIL